MRQRSMVAAVLAVTVALAAGGGLLIVVLQLNLRSEARLSGTSRSDEVAALLRDDGPAAAAEAIQEEARSGQFVQILTPDGHVVAASNKLVARTAMSTLRPPAGTVESVVLDIDTLGQGGDWMLVARGVRAGAQDYVVQVAIPIDTQRQTLQTVAVFLILAAPLLLIGSALAVWVLVGRALRPVERIRQTVATIDERRLDERISVPPSRDEIADLAATMNVMLGRLQAADGALRAFISDANHELRSPLATLTTAVELATDSDEPTRTELLIMMDAELTRMRQLVDDLLTLTRADTQGLVGDRTDVDLDDLLDQELRRLRSTSTHAVSARFTPVRVHGDSRRLAQALRNVIDNAERHAATSVRMTLLLPRPDLAELDIDNDGPILPPADRERIFERFVRLDDSRARDVGGSGLGLAISREILQAQNGSIDAVEAPDGWCRFRLQLPAEPPASPPDAGQGEAATSGSSSSAPVSGAQ